MRSGPFLPYGETVAGREGVKQHEKHHKPIILMNFGARPFLAVRNGRLLIFETGEAGSGAQVEIIKFILEIKEPRIRRNELI